MPNKPTVDTSSAAFKSICAFIRSVPMNGRSRNWRSDPAGLALMVQQVLSIDPYAVVVPDAVGKACGFSGQIVRIFCRGLDHNYQAWPDLRKELDKLGVKWLPTKCDIGRISQPSRGGLPSASKPAADAVPPAAFTVREPSPVAVAPVADPAPVRAQTLVVTNGSVEVAAPPAKAERAVVKPDPSPARNWRIEPTTQDILVTTTKRYVYGTPEHRAKLSEVMLQLGSTKA